MARSRCKANSLVPEAYDQRVFLSTFFPLGSKTYPRTRPKLWYFFVGVEHFLGWSPVRHVDIRDVAQLPKKEAQIVFFGETCQLRYVVQPNIDDSADVRIADERKKNARLFFG